mmetsp:Transcript_29906/g.77451  ORF Transcript_29906/g.77451 Transcript_29906/m.77451 type:complete len:221 (+) Transcript_29906:2606-3268(+)
MLLFESRGAAGRCEQRVQCVTHLMQSRPFLAQGVVLCKGREWVSFLGTVVDGDGSQASIVVTPHGDRRTVFPVRVALQLHTSSLVQPTSVDKLHGVEVLGLLAARCNHVVVNMTVELRCVCLFLEVPTLHLGSTLVVVALWCQCLEVFRLVASTIRQCYNVVELGVPLASCLGELDVTSAGTPATLSCNDGVVLGRLELPPLPTQTRQDLYHHLAHGCIR